MTTWPDSVWLVGLSAAGKSTVGPLLAERLGYEFEDIDATIEAREGRSIADIFRAEGEAAFRRLEARVSDELAGRSGLVVATGGGWMARRDIETSAPGRVRVWLRVSPDEAEARNSSSPGTRPLLADDGLAALRRLLDRREAAYREAEVAVDTDGRSPAQVVEEVLERLGRRGVTDSG